MTYLCKMLAIIICIGMDFKNLKNLIIYIYIFGILPPERKKKFC